MIITNTYNQYHIQPRCNPKWCMQLTTLNFMPCGTIKTIEWCLRVMPSPALSLEILDGNCQGDQCHDRSHFHSWWSVIVDTFPTGTPSESWVITPTRQGPTILVPNILTFENSFTLTKTLRWSHTFSKTPCHHQHGRWDSLTTITSSRHPSHSLSKHQTILTPSEFSCICPNMFTVLSPHPITTVTFTIIQ